MHHMDVAEGRLHTMSGHAASGSQDVRENVREATVLFYRGTNTLNEVLNPSGPSGDWTAPQDDIEDCARVLTKLIEYRLENADQRLAALRAKEAKEGREALEREGQARLGEYLAKEQRERQEPEEPSQ